LPAPHPAQHSARIDAIKAVASQIIVLHHLSLYAPMAEWIAPAWPRLFDFLFNDGRLAVQPFLVMGGFLAAQALERRDGRIPWRLIGRRYLRLAPPLWAALLLVVGATLLVGGHLAGAGWLSPPPSAGAFIAHLLFLQDILGIPSISAGAWYVAIDFQLYALIVILARLTNGAGQPLASSRAPFIMAGAAIASFFVFNRRPELDVWAIYFLWAYGLGALAGWAARNPRARFWLWLTAALFALDWLLEPRARPMLALLTALVLCARNPFGAAGAANTSNATDAANAADATGAAGARYAADLARRGARWLGGVSYSVFVCHYAVIILMSGLWRAWDLTGLTMAVSWFLLTWALALAAGAGVQRAIDQRSSRITLE
jgi:peptidoglycan/LPS O-acetylase OafA/YrhL